MNEQDKQSDHDLLIRVDEKLDGLIGQFSNHLKHHFRYNILAWTIALGAIVTLAIALLSL
jgi:hypothetical protein